MKTSSLKAPSISSRVVQDLVEVLARLFISARDADARTGKHWHVVAVPSPGDNDRFSSLVQIRAHDPELVATGARLMIRRDAADSSRGFEHYYLGDGTGAVNVHGQFLFKHLPKGTYSGAILDRDSVAFLQSPAKDAKGLDQSRSAFQIPVVEACQSGLAADSHGIRPKRLIQSGNRKITLVLEDRGRDEAHAAVVVKEGLLNHCVRIKLCGDTYTIPLKPDEFEMAALSGEVRLACPFRELEGRVPEIEYIRDS